jgi:hypothetical protein
MNSTLSTRQTRLVAILAVVVVAAGGFMVVTHHKSQPSTASSTPSVTTPAHTKTTPSTSAPSKAHTHAASPAATRVETAIAHGLPIPVARALGTNGVVVVGLFAPHSDVDSVAMAEARAGASASGARFVPIDVFHQRPGTAILRKLGVVNTPDVLVVKRPYLITSEFPGFADRDVVEQAVADAR